MPRPIKRKGETEAQARRRRYPGRPPQAGRSNKTQSTLIPVPTKPSKSTGKKKRSVRYPLPIDVVSPSSVGVAGQVSPRVKQKRTVTTAKVQSPRARRRGMSHPVRPHRIGPREAPSGTGGGHVQKGFPQVVVCKEFNAEMERLAGVYSPAMCFAAQYLIHEDWCHLPPSRIADPIVRALTHDAGADEVHHLVIGPREFAKTRNVQIAMLYDGLMLRRLTQTHMSINHRLAKKKLRILTRQLEENRQLQADFQLLPGHPQTTEEFHVRVGLRHPTDICFQAVGFGSTVRGERESRLVADDVDDALESPLVWAGRYEKLKSTVLGALKRTDVEFAGQLVVVGNYVGEGCCVELLEKNDVVEMAEMWRMHKFSAMETGETAHKTQVAVGKSVWPEFRSTENLQQLRRAMNIREAYAFEREYQNINVPKGDRIWHRDYFQERYEELPHRSMLASCVCLDPAEAEDEAEDHDGVVTMAKCIEGPETGKYYVLDAWDKAAAPRDVAQECIRQYIGPYAATNPRCDWLYIERKTSKGTGSLAEVVKTVAGEENVCMNIGYSVPRSFGDKRQRALKVVDLARRGLILFPKHLSMDMKTLLEQLIMFTGRGQRAKLPAIDDLHDAFVWCLLHLRRKKRSAANFITHTQSANAPKAVGT